MVDLKKERPKDIGRAYRLLKTSRSSLGYQSTKDDSALIERLRNLAIENPREGFWKCHYRIRNSGEKISYKRVKRVYKQIELPLRIKHKKRLPILR